MEAVWWAELTWFQAATTTRPMLTAKSVPTIPVATLLPSRKSWRSGAAMNLLA